MVTIEYFRDRFSNLLRYLIEFREMSGVKAKLFIVIHYDKCGHFKMAR